MEKSPAPALSKGLYIVDLVAEEEVLSFGEIQRHTGYNVSSLNRYLKVLLEAGYLMKNKDQKYSIGLKPTRLASHKSIWKKLIQVSTPKMKKLREHHEVTILLLGYGEQQYTCIAKSAHKDNLTMMVVGKNEADMKNCLPWGVAYTAYNLEDEINHEMLQAVNSMKNQGYFLYESGNQKEITRVAIPIKNRHEQVIGVLGMGTFSNKLSKEKLEVLIKEMMTTSRDIELELNY